MRIHNVLPLFAAVIGAVGLAACNDQIPRPNPQPSGAWLITRASNASCTNVCSISHEYFLNNTRASQRSVEIQVYANDIDGASADPYPQAFDVGGLQRKSLGCSPRPSATRQCGIEYCWKVEGVLTCQDSGWAIAPAPPSRSALDVALDSRRDAILGKAHALSTASNCAARCRSKDPGCVRVDVDPDGNDPVGSITGLIRGARPNGSVPVVRLLAALGQTDNVCERSDLVVEGDHMLNHGITCSWGAGTGAFALDLVIPDSLGGAISGKDGTLSLKFDSKRGAFPQVIFKDPAIQDDFGGPILQAEQVRFSSPGSEGDYLVLSGTKNCIALGRN